MTLTLILIEFTNRLIKTELWPVFWQVIAHLKLVAGKRVAVMINNLGGTSLLEMNIISAETKDYLGKYNDGELASNQLASSNFTRGLLAE